jgi:hypothetical protein
MGGSTSELLEIASVILMSATDTIDKKHVTAKDFVPYGD